MVLQQKKTVKDNPGSKPRIVEFKQGEIVFHEKDKAEALYIIKEGQIRLFRPKGNGFVEIAVLRKGEVIGEMAFFDENQARRSCSASALVKTKVIEISFKSFGKAIKNLNPWFKTIIFTLADRLRDSNDLVKSLEDNSLSYGVTKSNQYKFFDYSDLVKLLNYFLIVFNGHGEKVEAGFKIERKTLKYHLLDVFNFPEAKLEEFIKVVEEINYLQVLEDEKKNPNILVLTNQNFFKNALHFIDKQRRLDERKRIEIPPRTESFMGKIIEQLKEIQADPKGYSNVNLTKIIEEFKKKKLSIGIEDFLILISQGLADEVISNAENESISKVNIVKVRELFPIIRFINTIEKINKEKAEKN